MSDQLNLPLLYLSIDQLIYQSSTYRFIDLSFCLLHERWVFLGHSCANAHSNSSSIFSRMCFLLETLTWRKTQTEVMCKVNSHFRNGCLLSFSGSSSWKCKSAGIILLHSSEINVPHFIKACGCFTAEYFLFFIIPATCTSKSRMDQSVTLLQHNTF